MSFANGGLIVNGTIGNLNASILTANSITADTAYSLTYLRRTINEQIEQTLADNDTDYSDDDYEAGHAEGYTSGFVEGLAHILSVLEKKR